MQGDGCRQVFAGFVMLARFAVARAEAVAVTDKEVNQVLVTVLSVGDAIHAEDGSGLNE